MRNETVQLFIETDADAASAALRAILAATPGLRRFHVGRNLDGCWGAGSHTVDLEWDAAVPVADAAQLFAGVPGFARPDAVT